MFGHSSMLRGLNFSQEETVMSEQISRRRRSLTGAGAIAAAAPILNALFGKAAHAAEEGQAAWYVRGTVIEGCSCEVACPCAFGNAPTAGHCSAVVGWHVSSGRFGVVALDGFNVVMSFHSPGHTAKGNWKLGWYVDQRATPQQREALTAIFSGKAGGPLAFLSGQLVAERLGVKAARIEYEGAGKRHRMTVSGLGELDITAIEGKGGGEVTIGNLPIAFHTSEERVVAKSSRLTYRDFGFDWNITGKNGNYSDFLYVPS